jgi:hypothetical protein
MGDRFGCSLCGGAGFFRWGKPCERGGLEASDKVSWVANV